jgi:hypothetical protein
VRFVGPGSSGASEHKTKKKTMNDERMINFFMGYYTDICFFVNN